MHFLHGGKLTIMTTTLDPKAALEFQNAIIDRDVERVKAALKAGADPGMLINGGSAKYHPLQPY